MYHRLQNLLLGTAEVLRRLLLALLNDALPTAQLALRWLGDYVIEIQNNWRILTVQNACSCMRIYVQLSLLLSSAYCEIYAFLYKNINMKI
jgi:hypothetical protein